MPRYKITAPDGKSIMVEGPKPPTESDLDEIFDRMKQREAIVAPAVHGAMQRNAQANEMGPGGDPRLSAAQNVNMERATNTGIALAPVAGAVVGAPLVAAGGRAIGAALNPAVSGALASGATGLLQGHGLRGAAMDAVAGYAGGKTVGALLGGAGRFLGRALGGAASSAAAPAAEAAAAEAAPVAQTVSKLMMEAPKPTEVIPGFDTTMLMRLKVAYENPEARKQIREFVKAQAPEVAKQLKAFLVGHNMR